MSDDASEFPRGLNARRNDRPRVPSKDLRVPVGGRCPELDQALPVAGGQDGPVGAEAHRLDAGRMGGEPADEMPVREVPVAHRPILLGERGTFPGGVDGHVVHLASAVEPQGLPRFGGRQVPCPDRPVLPQREDRPRRGAMPAASPRLHAPGSRADRRGRARRGNATRTREGPIFPGKGRHCGQAPGRLPRVAVFPVAGGQVHGRRIGLAPRPMLAAQRRRLLLSGRRPGGPPLAATARRCRPGRGRSR